MNLFSSFVLCHNYVFIYVVFHRYFMYLFAKSMLHLPFCFSCFRFVSCYYSFVTIGLKHCCIITECSIDMGDRKCIPSKMLLQKCLIYISFFLWFILRPVHLHSRNLKVHENLYNVSLWYILLLYLLSDSDLVSKWDVVFFKWFENCSCPILVLHH